MLYHLSHLGMQICSPKNWVRKCEVDIQILFQGLLAKSTFSVVMKCCDVVILSTVCD